MRKTFGLLLFIGSFILLGCGFIPVTTTGRPACQDGYYRSGRTCVYFEGDLIAADQAVQVNDSATDYVIPTGPLQLYTYGVDPDTEYVDVEQFLAMLGSAITTHSVEIDEVLTVTVTYGAYQIGPSLTLDAGENELRYSDFDFDTALVGQGLTEYETELEAVGYHRSGGTAEKTIELDRYDIVIVRYRGNFYVPLYLANLLFTGQALNVCRAFDALYVFDDAENVESVLSGPAMYHVSNQEVLVQNTAKCAALLFDHFYGLKETAEIDSFVTLFHEIGLFDAESIVAFDEMFTAFIYSLDDLHTSIILYGFQEGQVDAAEPPPTSRLHRFIANLIASETFDRMEDIILREYENYYILEVNTFDLDTKDLLAHELDGLDPNKDIIIDLSCNTGGSFIAVIELLSYLTDETIGIRFTNPATESRETIRYAGPEGRALPNRFFVYTSQLTFSAANLFVSIVNDMELAFVFGTHTGGGAAAVGSAVLPNNLVLSYSSNMVFTDNAGAILETGVDPDWMMNDAEAADFAAVRLTRLYADAVGLEIDNVSTSGTIAFEFHAGTLPVDIDFIGYAIEIYDAEADLLVASLTATEPSGSFASA
ncbi:MAG: S41 family peptidase, partial [Bacillota bacterium]|nr:S41 family peptidase [Bacillota bacterium]